jgi:tetratricopeptide (TPR) repeat protein
MLPLDERYPALKDSPQQKRELVMTVYSELLAGLAARRPVVVLFEDIHWIDPTSLDLLDRTITQIAHLPVLLIATFRPEHQPAWVGQPHVTLLHLNRLGRRDSAAIISEVACDKPFPQPIVDQIIDRTDGVPLFVKELSRHMLESGLLNETADSHALKGPLPPFSIPTKLRAVLSVRLERLGTARRLALIGAVIGRRFSRELIAAVLDTEFADLDEALDRLTASGLMSRRGTPPDDSYAFTHALVHDAAYDMILKDERRRLHSRIANIMIDRFSAHADGPPEVVARHLSQAGRAAEAAEYWVTAARLAHARWANRESADFFDLALSAIDELPRTPATLQSAVDLRFEIKNALTPLGEFDRIIDYLQEARTLIAQLDDPQRLCQFNVHMGQVLGLSGKSHEAIAFGQEAERLAGSLTDSRLLIEATVFLATAYFTIMDYRQAERLFLQVLQLLEDEPSGKRFALAGSPGITAGAYLTRINAVRGEFEQGILYGEKAVRQAEALAQPYSLSMSIWCLADLHLTRGDIAPAVELLERGLALSRRWDLPFLVAGHSGSLGYAYALMKRADEGLPLLEQAMTVFEKMRHQFALSLFLVPLGEVYVMAGRFDQAGDLARRALKLAQESGHRSSETGSRYILGDVAARTDSLEEAELQYRDALALAEDLGMRPLVARCRHGLANVRARRSEPEKARIDLAAATVMYRDMGMGFWLRQLEASM